MHAKPLVLIAALAAFASAKTDLEGCTSSQTVAYGGASMIFWVPDTGEICSFLDCGGGRAPPKTTVPGCPQYEGTATYSPDYMAGWGADATPTPSASASLSSAPVTTSAEEKPSPTETRSQGDAAEEKSSSSESHSQSDAEVTTEQSFVTRLPTISMSTGTGKPSPSGSANGTATFSAGDPSQPTGGAVALGAMGQGVVGLAGVVAGLALL